MHTCAFAIQLHHFYRSRLFEFFWTNNCIWQYRLLQIYWKKMIRLERFKLLLYTSNSRPHDVQFIISATSTWVDNTIKDLLIKVWRWRLNSYNFTIYYGWECKHAISDPQFRLPVLYIASLIMHLSFLSSPKLHLFPVLFVIPPS